MKKHKNSRGPLLICGAVDSEGEHDGPRENNCQAAGGMRRRGQGENSGQPEIWIVGIDETHAPDPAPPNDLGAVSLCFEWLNGSESDSLFGPRPAVHPGGEIVLVSGDGNHALAIDPGSCPDGAPAICGGEIVINEPSVEGCGVTGFPEIACEESAFLAYGDELDPTPGLIDKQSSIESDGNPIIGILGVDNTATRTSVERRYKLTAESAPAKAATELPVPLSPRERDVLYWLARGKSGPSIAGILAIRPSTVRAHIRAILHKFNAANLHHAIARAFQSGVL